MFIIIIFSNWQALSGIAREDPFPSLPLLLRLHRIRNLLAKFQVFRYTGVTYIHTQLNKLSMCPTRLYASRIPRNSPACRRLPGRPAALPNERNSHASFTTRDRVYERYLYSISNLEPFCAECRTWIKFQSANFG